ncbi:MAG: hypothetical protein PHN74_01190 [Candidatus Pacebacteria bacterium]|nr:hypothetical protein [Candidatus Paceibacterota bacterium]
MEKINQKIKFIIIGAVSIAGAFAFSQSAFAWSNPAQSPPAEIGSLKFTSGFLGIGGIVTPSQSLQIKSASINGVYPLDLLNNSSGRRAAFYIANENGSIYFYDSAGAEKILLTSYWGNPSYINTSGGNFGIGTTDPQYKLDVKGSVRATSNIWVYGSIIMSKSDGVIQMRAGTAALPGIVISGDENTGIFSSGADKLSFSAGGTERITMLDNGNVGIGTATPDSAFTAMGGTFKLQVKSGEIFTSGFYAQPGGTTYLGNTIYNYATDADLTVNPRTTSKNLLLATGTGNVGIGTTAPLGKLDIGSTGTLAFGAATEKIESIGHSSGKYITITARGGATSARSIWMGRRGDDYNYLWMDTDATKFSFQKGMQIVGGSNIYGNLVFGGSTYLLGMGGSPIYGNNTSSGNLILDSTSSGTKGFVLINPSGGNVGVATTSPGAVFAVNGTIYSNTGYKFPDGALITNGAGLNSWTRANPNTYPTTIGNNIGIGTSSPDEKLHVAGNIKLSGTGKLIWGMNSWINSSDGLFTLNAPSNSLKLDVNPSGVSQILTSGASSLTLGASSTERIRISAAGNVGINSTDPGVEFDVTGRGRFSQGMQITGWQTFPSGTGLIMRDAGTYKEIQSFNSTPLALNPAGNNVGIGTTDPIATFTAQGAVSDIALFKSTGSSYGTVNIDVGGTGIPNLQFKQAGTAKAAIGVDSLGKLIFGLADTSAIKMTIDTNGNVGIGTTTPLAQLYVAGRTTPVQTGSVGSSSNIYNTYMAIQGNYAYQVDAEDSSVLQVIDISNPASPEIISSTNLGAISLDIAVQGKYAYITGPDLKVFDISNPKAPVNISTLGIVGDKIYVQGKYAYVATNVNYGAQTLKIVDISNPFVLTTAGSVAATNIPTDIFVQGRYAYIAGYDANCKIADISNPASPVIVSSFSTTDAATSIYVQGRYAYISTSPMNSGNLLVYDISNPAAPSNIATLGLGNDVKSIYAQGRYVYAGVRLSNSVQVIDVSNPATPVLFGSVGVTAPWTVSVRGRYAYVGNGNSLTVIDLGGAYIQQLEAGGIETGTLSIRTNASINNDLDIRGGLQIGGGLAAYGASSFFSTSTDSVLTVARKGATYPTIFKQGTDGAFVLNNNNADVMTLKSSKIGIGTTTPSLSYGTLTVGGTGLTISDDGNAKLQIGRYSAAGGNDYSYIKPSTVSQGIRFSNSADTDWVTIKNNGNVGIGTTDPGIYKLSVSGSLDSTGIYENGTTLNNTYVNKSTWTTHDNYPSACGSGFASGIGDSLTCGFNTYTTYATKSGAEQRIQSYGYADITIDRQADTDPNGLWTSNYYYDCPVDGYYQVEGGFMASDIQAYSPTSIAVAVNGTIKCFNKKPQLSGAGYWESWNVSCIVYCTTSTHQYITLQAQSDDGDFKIQNAVGAAYTFISVNLVSK